VTSATRNPYDKKSCTAAAVTGMSFFPAITVLLLILLASCLPTAHARQNTQSTLSEAHQVLQWAWDMHDNMLEAEAVEQWNDDTHQPELLPPQDLFAAFENAVDTAYNPAAQLAQWLYNESPPVVLLNGTVVGLHQVHDSATAVSSICLSPLYFSIMRRLFILSNPDFMRYFAGLMPALINLIYGNACPVAYHYTPQTFAGLIHVIFNLGVYPVGPMLGWPAMHNMAHEMFQWYLQINHGSALHQTEHPTDLLMEAVAVATMPNIMTIMQPMVLNPGNDMVQSVALVLAADMNLAGHANPLLLIMNQPYEPDTYINDVMYVTQHSELVFDVDVIQANDQVLMNFANQPSAVPSVSPVVAPPSPIVVDDGVVPSSMAVDP